VVLTVAIKNSRRPQYENLLGALPAQYQAFSPGRAGKARLRGTHGGIDGSRSGSGKKKKKKKKKTQARPGSKLKEEIAFQRENILAQAMFENLQNSVKVDDAAVEKVL